MNKLLTTVLTGATALATALTLVPAPASAAAPPIRYWNEATAGLNVNGTYRTVVGDFAAGPTDDIVWNTNTSATDHLWTSNGDATFATQALGLQPPADAVPIVGDFVGDAKEDIFWYGPGSAPDVMWMASGGSFRAATGRVSGTYSVATLENRTGKDSIVYYDATTGTGSIWAFGPAGAFASRPFSGPARARLIVGHFNHGDCADLYLYAQTGRDPLMLMDCNGRAASTSNQTLGGGFTPYVGQFSPGRDAQDDILWIDPAGIKNMLAENLDRGHFTRSYPDVPDTGTLLRTANGYATLHQWTPTTGRHHIWFQVPGGLSFRADLTNTAMPSGSQPIVGAFVGSGEDILWYRPGSGAERLFHLPG
jgi:hypothetical protein